MSGRTEFLTVRGEVRETKRDLPLAGREVSETKGDLLLAEGEVNETRGEFLGGRGERRERERVEDMHSE